MDDTITIIAIVLGVVAFFNSGHLRKRLNKIEGQLEEKGILHPEELI